MIRICICDDDVSFGSTLEGYILEYVSRIEGLEVDVDVYEKGSSLTEAIIDKKESYQVAFLDIEMKGLDGIDTAKKIRMVDKKLYIIYVTSYEKYTLESFKVSPFRYVIKPIIKDDFQSILAQVIEEVLANKQFLFFKYQGAQYQVKSDSIMCIKSEKGRMINIASAESLEPFIFYGKIKEIEKKLNPILFVKVNPGTIVNLNYVNIITSNEIKMENGETYPISRGQKQEVKIKYNIFLERRAGL